MSSPKNNRKRSLAKLLATLAGAPALFSGAGNITHALIGEVPGYNVELKKENCVLADGMEMNTLESCLAKSQLVIYTGKKASEYNVPNGTNKDQAKFQNTWLEVQGATLRELIGSPHRNLLALPITEPKVVVTGGETTASDILKALVGEDVPKAYWGENWAVHENTSIGKKIGGVAADEPVEQGYYTVNQNLELISLEIHEAVAVQFGTNEGKYVADTPEAVNKYLKTCSKEGVAKELGPDEEGIFGSPELFAVVKRVGIDGVVAPTIQKLNGKGALYGTFGGVNKELAPFAFVQPQEVAGDDAKMLKLFKENLKQIVQYVKSLPVADTNKFRGLQATAQILEIWSTAVDNAKGVGALGNFIKGYLKDPEGGNIHNLQEAATLAAKVLRGDTAEMSAVAYNKYKKETLDVADGFAKNSNYAKANNIADVQAEVTQQLAEANNNLKKYNDLTSNESKTVINAFLASEGGKKMLDEAEKKGEAAGKEEGIAAGKEAGKKAGEKAGREAQKKEDEPKLALLGSGNKDLGMMLGGSAITAALGVLGGKLLFGNDKTKASGVQTAALNNKNQKTQKPAATPTPTKR